MCIRFCEYICLDDRYIMLNRTRLIAVVEMNNCLEPTKYDQLRSKLGIEGIESGDSARSPRLQLLSTDNFCRFCKCALEGKRVSHFVSVVRAL